jgi:hypothetical protein
MTPLAQLKKIEQELDKIARDCAPRGRQKIKPTDAFTVANLGTQIIESAAMITGEARQIQQPNRLGVKERLVKKTRAALGYMYP